MKHIRFFGAIIALFAIHACDMSQKKPIKIEWVNFGEEIALQQNLVFAFNENISSDTVGGRGWKTTEYIAFEPRVKGMFRWKDAKTLEFSPTEGFAPSTDYKAVLTDKFEEILNNTQKPGDSRDIRFHTPYLQLGKADVFWAVNEIGSPEVRVKLDFNYEVDPKNISELIEIKMDGLSTDFKVNGETPAKSLLVSMPPSAEKLDMKPLDIHIKAGTRVEGGNRKAQEMKFVSEIPNKLNFAITNASVRFGAEGESFIQVSTNQAVGKEPVENFIKLSPKVEYTVERLDYGFILKGAFATGQVYQLAVSKEMEGVFGSGLDADFSQSVVFGDLAPQISFAGAKALYLSSKGNRNLGARIVNVPKINIKVYKIFRNNLAHFVERSGLLNSYYDYEGLYLDEQDLKNFGDLVYEQKEINSSSLKTSNGLSLIDFDFEDKSRKDYEGIYAVIVESNDDRWRRAGKILAVSDLGFIVKETPEEVLVFVNSIKEATPVSGAEIKLVSSNNQEIYTVISDGNGIARFTDLKSKAAGFKVAMITAKKDADFNFMHFANSGVNADAFELGGLWASAESYHAFLYGDRSLYRPDETANIKAIVRDNRWKSPKGMPVKLKILFPNGEEFVSKRGELNQDGTFETSVYLPSGTVTGSYVAQLYTSNDMLLNSYSLDVEEFMPDRIKVEVGLNGETQKPGGTVLIKGTAVNLFGPPAAKRRYENNFTLDKQYFSPKGLESYTFDLSGLSGLTLYDRLAKGETDAKGEFTSEFKIPDEYAGTGVLEGAVFTSVFDETGRPVNRRSRFVVSTQDLYYGIGTFEYWVSARQPVNIPVVAVDINGWVAKTAKAKVKIVKHEWNNVLERSYQNTFRYVAQNREKIVLEKEIDINGKGTSITFMPNLSGRYEVRVYAPGSDKSYVGRQFYSYSSGYTDNSSFEIDKDGQILLETDKEEYRPGDKAKVLLKAPFDGTVLVTVERNKVFQHRYLKTQDKTASFEIDVTDEHLPNAYISATLIRPLDAAGIPLTVAHGYANLKVKDERHEIKLDILAPESVRSDRQHTITVKTAKKESDVEITVAVVDEGILQIKNHATPDPIAYFFQKRSLQVRSYDLYARLFDELKPSYTSFGADYYDLGKRTNPVANKRVKLLSFWSGTLKTNKKGEVNYTINLPHFSGQARIMAVACKGDAFGSAYKNIKIADPLVISMGVPRFLSPSDKAFVPVTVSNTTDKPAKGKVRINAFGAVKLNGKAEERIIDLPANSEAQTVFEITADKASGTASVKAEVEAFGEKFTQNIDLTVRPSVSLLKTSGSGTVEGGKKTLIDLKKDFMETAADGRLVISNSPLAEFAYEMDKLLGYPYGCAEQTISKAFPQLYFKDLGQSLGLDNKSQTGAEHNVAEAIRKLEGMMLYDGSLAYWPGGTYQSWWATVYALHFLQEAEKAGFETDKEKMRDMYDFIKQKAKRKATEEYAYTDGNGRRVVKKTAPREAIYALYVLALAHQKELPTMNYYKSHPELLSLDSKYMLAAAFRFTGDKEAFKNLLPAKFEGEKSPNASDGSFYSYIRDQALSLNVLLETDAGNPQIPEMARRLAELMKQQKNLNTQELAFGLLALGKLAKQAAVSEATAEIWADGVKIGDFTGKTLALKNVAGKKTEIIAKGKGNVYYFYEMSGTNDGGRFKEEDAMLRVRRTFYDRNGNSIAGNKFKQGDLIVVGISLQSLGGKIENVAVTDMLPAGLEVENPRIGGIDGIGWIKNASFPQHSDFRDDRINFFTAAEPSVKTYYFAVRAVSKGVFKRGPVSADAMYNGAYRSYNGGGEVRVE